VVDDNGRAIELGAGRFAKAYLGEALAAVEDALRRRSRSSVCNVAWWART
jgi:hypothetical protein